MYAVTFEAFWSLMVILTLGDEMKVTTQQCPSFNDCFFTTIIAVIYYTCFIDVSIFTRKYVVECKIMDSYLSYSLLNLQHSEFDQTK